jgi:hypothetical protein
MTTPYTTFQNIVDPSGKLIFGSYADMSSIAVPTNPGAIPPEEVTGNVGFSLNSWPGENTPSFGYWNLYGNPTYPTINGAYWEFTNPTDIPNFGGLVLKRANGTVFQNGDNDDPGNPLDPTDYQYATSLYLVEQRNDLASARVLRTLAIWSGSTGYNSGVISVPARTFYIVPWNTPGNNSIGGLVIGHYGYYRQGTNNYYTLDGTYFGGSTQNPLTYNGYTWPTPLNGPVSTTLWTP